MATRLPQVRVGGKNRQMPAGDAVPVAAGGTGATSAAAALAVLGALPTAGGEMTGVQSFAAGMTASWGSGTLLGPRVITGTLTAFAANWYRLMSFPTSNSGHAVEFYFVIPARHVLLKVKFGKTTKSTLFGAGFLEVELLGSYAYGHAHPYLWRVVDNGTNSTTHIDIRFPNADGSALAYAIHLMHTLRSSGLDVSCPMNSVGPAGGGGVTNYGLSMGTGAGEGWTTQKFKLSASSGLYVAESNTFARTTGTASAM